MSSWSQKRRMAYAGSILTIVLIIAIWGGVTLFYKAPTCFDAIKNGDETGIDCGGSCVKLCASAFLPPRVVWANFEQVAPGLYNVAAYIINPNTEGAALNVPYHIVLYDSQGMQISDTSGRVNIPPHRDTLAFIPAVKTGQSVPYRTFFEFLAAPEWKKQSDKLGALQVTEKKYTEDMNSSSLVATLHNSSVYPFGRMSVYAVLSDASSTVIGFSKTVIDGIAPQSTVYAPFTWPVSRNGRVISKEVLPVAE